MFSSCVNKQPLLFVLLVISFISSPAYGEKILPKEIEVLANKYGIPIESLSIIMQPVDADTRLINLNPEMNRTPASVLKLFTAFVAIEHLEPDFHWTTEVYSTDSVNDGAVDSLIFKGGGDPYITIERLEKMVLQLRNLGIKTINDGLIVDQNFFQQPQISTADFDDDPLRPYNISHSSFLINSNRIDFKITKNSNNTIQINPEFLPDNVSVTNELELGSGSCSDFREHVNFSQMNREKKPFNFVILVNGQYPRNCNQFEHDISLTDANHYFLGSFKKIWLESGGLFNGYIREGKAGFLKRPIIAFDSPRLEEIIIEAVKESDNLIARNLFLSLNQSLGQKNYKTSRRIMNNVLIDHGVVINSDTFFENGSGLSRKSTISPEAVLSLLKAIKRHPSSEIILKSLPISGVDGTLENKYKSDLLTNRLKLKTGTLDGVRGLAGFITGLSGKEYAFVFLHNSISDHSSETATFTTDLLNWAVSNN